MIIAILAGGKSRRMGVDKANLSFGGGTFLEHIASTARQQQCRTIVVGRERDDDFGVDGVEFIADHYSDVGPVGGLATIFEIVEDAVMLLPCDMPLLDGEALQWLMALYEDILSDKNADYDGIVTVSNGRIQPLFAIYSPRLKHRVNAALKASRLSLTSLIGRAGFYHADVPDWIAAKLQNINNPDDYDAILSGRET